MPKLRAVLVVAVAAGLVLPATSPATAVQHAESLPLNSTGIPQQFANQVLDWHLCRTDELPSTPPPGAENLQCATYQTPRNWNNLSDPRTLTIAISKLPAHGEATQSTFINPGGPGGPGRLYAAKLRNQKRVRFNSDVIGFDVRGTGHSTNVTCGGAFNRSGQSDSRNRDETNLRTILATTKAMVNECQDNAGDLGPLITTAQTVRDLDLLRLLLRRSKINWVGYSAGTWLGAHYAQANPRRVGRFVFDSSVQFTGTWERNFALQPTSVERRWRKDFLPWMAKYDKIYGFGSTAEQVHATYEQLRKAIVAKPVDYNGVRYYADLLDSTVGYNGIAWKGRFESTAAALVELKRLTATGTSPAAKSAAARKIKQLQAADKQSLQPAAADAGTATFWSLLCNEGSWPGTPDTAIADSQRYLDQGDTMVGGQWLSQPCIFWNKPGDPLPVIDGRGVPPVLMLHSEHDGLTAIEGARRAHAGFANSRLITVTGEGDHGLYATQAPFSNTRLDTLVEDYLVDGVVPDDQSIPGTALPVPPGA